MAEQTGKKENQVYIPVRWMRVEEAAQYLRVSTNFLNKARITKIPNIPFTRIGGRILYDRQALDKFLESLSPLCNYTLSQHPANSKVRFAANRGSPQNLTNLAGYFHS